MKYQLEIGTTFCNVLAMELPRLNLPLFIPQTTVPSGSGVVVVTCAELESYSSSSDFAAGVLFLAELFVVEACDGWGGGDSVDPN